MTNSGGKDAMTTPVHAMPVSVHAMPIPVPTKVLHAMPVQGGLVTDVLEKATPYESWVGLSEALPYVPPEPYIVVTPRVLALHNLTCIT